MMTDLWNLVTSTFAEDEQKEKPKKVVKQYSVQTDGLFEFGKLVDKKEVSAETYAEALSQAAVALALAVLRPMCILLKKPDYTNDTFTQANELVANLTAENQQLFYDGFKLTANAGVNLYQSQVINLAVQLMKKVLGEYGVLPDEQLRILAILCLDAKIYEHFRQENFSLPTQKHAITPVITLLQINLRDELKQELMKMDKVTIYFESSHAYGQETLGRDILNVFIYPTQDKYEELPMRWRKLTNHWKMQSQISFNADNIIDRMQPKTTQPKTTLQQQKK